MQTVRISTLEKLTIAYTSVCPQHPDHEHSKIVEAMLDDDTQATQIHGVAIVNGKDLVTVAAQVPLGTLVPARLAVNWYTSAT